MYFILNQKQVKEKQKKLSKNKIMFVLLRTTKKT